MHLIELSVLLVTESSTGYQLLTDGLVFGGSTLTATDVMVARDPFLSIGDSNKVKDGRIPREVIDGAKLTIKKLLEDVIDRGLFVHLEPRGFHILNYAGMKTNPEPATVLLVGGGSVIAPTELDGVGGKRAG